LFSSNLSRKPGADSRQRGVAPFALDGGTSRNYNHVVTIRSPVVCFPIAGRMLWIWTEAKNRSNKRDHGLSFEFGRLVFDDRLAISRPDPHPDGDRWQTVGLVGRVTLFVVHTSPEPDPTTNEPTGRIISARKATAHERKAYEEGDF
jgi:uncharacterized DUF497 family protein